MELTAIILAGGKSSRMGQDKGLMIYRGKRFVENAIDACSKITSGILISANNSEYDVLGYETVRDNYEGLGPIGGLEAALSRSKTSDNIVCPCDMPGIHAGLFNKILHKKGNNHAVVVARGDGKIFPVLGYYNKSALPVIRAQIEKKDYKLQSLLEKLGAKTVVVLEDDALLNVNYPEDVK